MNKDDHDLYLCPSCDLVFVFPQPDAESLRKKLYSFESGYQSNRAAEKLDVRKEYPRARVVLDYLEKNKPKARFLDVGCGNGQFMYWAEKRGFPSYGVEVNERTADSAKSQGLNVYTGFLEDAPLSPNSFDAIFLGELIEHVTNPRELVRTCNKLLTPQGLLAVTTPNIDCLWSRTTLKLYKIFGIPWSSVTPPYHLFQFSPKNLDTVVLSEGFNLKSSKYLRIPPLKYELGMLHLLKRYKKSRSIKDLFFMGFSYSIYTVLHTIFVLLHPFLRRDFQMVKIYERA